MADNVAAPRGVLVWLVGGPGEPGVRLTGEIAGQFDPAVLAQYRLVLFSSRGTGANALPCPRLQQVMGGSDLAVPPPGAVAECAQAIGPDRQFYTTADTVADLDALRQALGADKLTLDGASYGTFVAERYAITHPDRVARLVLDSVVPHDNYDPLGIAAFNRTAQVLGIVCGHIRCEGDPSRDLAQVIRRRHNGPQLLDTLSELTSGAPRLGDLPAALHAAAGGQDNTLDAIIDAATGHRNTPATHLSQGLHAATECEDLDGPWGNADTPTTSRGIATARAVAGLPDQVFFPFDRDTATGNGIVVTCELWPPTPTVPFPTTADLPAVPTLLLAGDQDLNTPLQWTQHEAAHAPAGRLIVIPGSGHITQDTANGSGGRASVTQFLTGR